MARNDRNDTDLGTDRDTDRGIGYTNVDRLRDMGYWETVVIPDGEFDNALVGVTDDGRAVYDFNKMAEAIEREQGWGRAEAEDWIENNVIRVLPFLGEDHPITGDTHPIVFCPIIGAEDME